MNSAMNAVATIGVLLGAFLVSPVCIAETADNPVGTKALAKTEELRISFNALKVALSPLNLSAQVESYVSRADSTLDEIENVLLGISSTDEAEGILEKTERTWAYLIAIELVGPEALKNTFNIKKNLEDCEMILCDLRMAIKLSLSDAAVQGQIPDNLKLEVGKAKAYVIVIEDLAGAIGLTDDIKHPISSVKTGLGEIEDALWGVTPENEAARIIDRLETLGGVATLCKLALSLGKDKTGDLTKAMGNLETTLNTMRVEMKKQYLKKTE